MIHLIASYDGMNGILMFPVEQNPDKGGVEYRLRWPDSTHLDLRSWGDPRTATAACFPLAFRLEDNASKVQGEWRPVKPRGEKEQSPWQPCAPAEFGESTATFRIDFLQPRPPEADRDLDVMGMSGDYPAVFRITLPPGAFASGDSVEAEGRSLDHGPGQYVRAGAFLVRSPAFRVSCVIGSQATLLSVPSAIPGKSRSPSRAFMVHGTPLPPEELEKFLGQKEVAGG